MVNLALLRAGTFSRRKHSMLQHFNTVVFTGWERHELPILMTAFLITDR